MKRTFQLLRAVGPALLLLGLLHQPPAATAQVEEYKGSSLYRAQNVMSGNLIRSTFYNYGLVGNIGEISGEWPIGTGNEYVGDVSPMVAVEFVHPSGDTLRSVTTTDGPRGNPDGPPGGGQFWGFEPLKDFNAQPRVGEDPRVAMSNQPETWPSSWPDKAFTDEHDRSWQRDPADPGWPGAWNGYFGKNVMNADQETFFQMDDHADLEWFQREDGSGNVHYYYPSHDDSTRRGLGLRVAVRGLQWSHFLAQDCIFWLYEITNISSYTYDKVAFGMMVGTLSGGRQDSEDDLAYFELGNDITYSWDGDDQGSPGWIPVRPGEINVGYVGYAFLESPGNPVDGIDNDGDSPYPSPVLTPSLLLQMTGRDSLTEGRQIVLIDYNNYERTVATLPAEGIEWFFRDQVRRVSPGNVVQEDGRNGIDDNFNGLIDERFDSTHIGHKYKDYLNGLGLDDILIDESRDDGIDNDGDWNPLTDDVGADGNVGTFDPGQSDGLPTNGEPHFDRTDVDESDQIGLSAFEYFAPPGAVRMRDDPGLWARMAPGHFDVVSPNPEDGDFIYASGYFPLRPGQTERFSMALLYGEDLPDITDNKITVQQIYNENYNFARPPDKPTLYAVPGDGRVTLYWDDIAERSFEPVCRCLDFEGYKIYRATDPGFNEVFSITDGLGRRVFHRPIAQFDLDNGNAGFFPTIRNSVIFYLGEDTGITHSWTDTTVENGQTYYYALVAYDSGIDSLQILPAENSKTIVVEPSGDITFDINTVVVTPRAPAAGYEPAAIQNFQHETGTATGAVAVEIIDPRQLAESASFAVSFTGQGPGQLAYTVERTVGGVTDTVIAGVPVVPDDNLITEANRFAAYYDSLFNLPPGVFNPAEHFRVASTALFQGQRAFMLLPRDTSLIREVSGWADTSKGLLNFTFDRANFSQIQLRGEKVPADFQIEWFDQVVDSSEAFILGPYNYPRVGVNFRARNLSSGQDIDFYFREAPESVNGQVDPNEAIILLDRQGDRQVLSWSVGFNSRAATGDTVRPQPGDVLTLRVYQPFSSNDRYVYTTRAARVNAAAVDLERIRVYPDPYVAVSAQEPTNPFNEGRGERRITFIHLPERCTIRIYTVRGDLVDTIDHSASIEDGSANWDLRSRDGLNVAYGTYLYHIESPYGEKTGRIAVIK